MMRLAGHDAAWQHLHVVRAFEGRLECRALQCAAATATLRHTIIAARLVESAECPTMVVGGPAPAPLYLEVDDLAEAEDIVQELFGRPFDLEASPPLRILAVETRRAGWILVLIGHHLYFDRRALEMVADEIGAHYCWLTTRAVPAPQYFDYVRWEREREQSSGYVEDISYWRRTVDGGRPELQHVRSPAALEGSRRRQLVAEVVSPASIQHAASTMGATPAAVWLVALQKALASAGESEDTLIQVISDARPPRFARTVGNFVDALFVRVGSTERLTPAVTATQRAIVHGRRRHVSAQVLFEDLQAFRRRRDDGVFPACDVVFHYHGRPSKNPVGAEAAGCMSVLARAAALDAAATTKHRRLALRVDISEHAVDSTSVIDAVLTHDSRLIETQYADAVARSMRVALGELVPITRRPQRSSSKATPDTAELVNRDPEEDALTYSY